MSEGLGFEDLHANVMHVHACKVRDVTVNTIMFVQYQITESQFFYMM